MAPSVRPFFRRDLGATDPILVIAAIAVSLILLVGGSFAVAGLLNNGKNLNAQNDLDRIATAEAAFQTQTGAFTPYDRDDVSGLQNATLGFTTSDQGFAAVRTCGNNASWYAASLSTSGDVFVRTSASNQTVKAPATAALKLPTCATLADIASLVSAVSNKTSGNLLANSSFENGVSTPWRYSNSNLFTPTVRTDGGSVGANYLSLKFTNTADGFGTGIYQNPIVVTPGKSYQASAAVRAVTTTGRGTIRIEWINAGGGNLPSSNWTSNTLSTSWSSITQTVTAPAGAATATVTVYTDGTWNAGDTWDIDAVTFVPTGA